MDDLIPENKVFVEVYLRDDEKCTVSLSGFEQSWYTIGDTLSGIFSVMPKSETIPFEIVGWRISYTNTSGESGGEEHLGNNVSFVIPDVQPGFDGIKRLGFISYVRPTKHKINFDNTYGALLSYAITLDGEEYVDQLIDENSSHIVSVTAVVSKEVKFGVYRSDVGRRIGDDVIISSSATFSTTLTKKSFIPYETEYTTDNLEVYPDDFKIWISSGPVDYYDFLKSNVNANVQENTLVLDPEVPDVCVRKLTTSEGRVYDGDVLEYNGHILAKDVDYTLDTYAKDTESLRLYKFDRWEFSDTYRYVRKGDPDVGYYLIVSNWKTVSKSHTYKIPVNPVAQIHKDFWYRPVWRRRRSCLLSISIPNQDYGSVELSRSPDYTNPEAWLEGEITFICTANAGYRPVNIVLTDMNYGTNGDVLIPVEGLDGKYRSTFDLTYDCEATINFEPIKCNVSAKVDDPSKNVGAGTASVTLDSNNSLTGKVGDIASFVAVANSGFSFVGWYKSDGTLVSSLSTYSATLDSDLHLIAKFGAKIKVETGCSNTAHGSVTLDGTTSTSSVEKVVVIGDTYTINATPTTANTDYFAWWYAKTDTEFRHVISSTASRTYTATKAVNLVARFVTEADFVYVGLRTSDVGTYGATAGDNPNMAIAEIQQSDFLTKTGLSSVPADTRKFYRLLGYSAFTSCVIPTAYSIGGVLWSKASISDGTIGEYETISTTQFVDEFYCTNNCILYANFSSSSEKKTHTRVKGDMLVSMSGKNESDKTETSTQISAKYSISSSSARSEMVISKAKDTNGSVFIGWYLDADFLRPMVNIGDCEYTDKEFVVPCISNLTMYCNSISDANAIFAWECSDENKRMRWTSKTYVASRPFDVVSARVDADGYTTGDGLDVTVAMYSSPDVSQDDADKRHLDVENQYSMRFERGRPERYMQVTIESEDAVNAVFVGTNSKELAV